ncbi:hypothetical protein CHF27_011185 [Romboutsia maritimum]|uniref:Phage protein n=1 Tax=Romboutsia maritimum TaxID=2020948 RepID=A0A371IQW1_9FIRM|nr:Gp49 family protein [Romboutsia maritimum]RDY22875.1 hypothetical protein CHF27_011185 [Romboutsia maritimum]
MKSNITVKQNQIDEIYNNSKFHVTTMLGKITIVVMELPCGFTLVESSACVDPTNYDENVGADICKSRFKDRLWYLEGYMLQNKVGKLK